MVTKIVKGTIRLGDIVDYRDREGRLKTALVVATTESIMGHDEHTGMPAPAEGTAHLQVFSFTGDHYLKTDVPEGDGPLSWSFRK